MEDHQVCGVAFTTGEVDPFFTAVLAHPGAPDFQLRVAATGTCKSCVTYLGELPMAVD